LEIKQEQKKNEKHTILKQCKINDISIPLKRGNLDDVDATAGGDTGVELDSNVSSQVIYSQEARLQIDYDVLSEDLMDLESDEVKKIQDKLASKLNDLNNTLLKIQAPNMKATQKLESAREKLQETNEEFDNVRKRAKEAKVGFEKIKHERHSKFMKCYDHVANSIDGIYKSLAQNQSAQAILGPENPEEPYLDGISYNCVAPGKRFQAMSNLSGGEKTVAALALLFAIHSYQPAPFFVLDENDAALDNTNIGKVARFIQQRTGDLQIIVISLKEEFYSHADALVGIAPDVSPGDCVVSKVYSLALENYPI